jgi:hypothetical protein
VYLNEKLLWISIQVDPFMTKVNKRRNAMNRTSLISIGSLLLMGLASYANADFVLVSQETGVGTEVFDTPETIEFHNLATSRADQIYRYRRDKDVPPNGTDFDPDCPVSFTGYLSIEAADLDARYPLDGDGNDSGIEMTGEPSAPVTAMSDTTQMWVADTSDGPALFVVYDFIDNSDGRCPQAAGPDDNETGGNQHLRFDMHGGLLRYLVQDDQCDSITDGVGRDLCTGSGVVGDQEVQYDAEDYFTDGGVYGQLPYPTGELADQTLVIRHHWQPSRTDGVVLGLPEACDWTLYIRSKDNSSSGITTWNFVDPIANNTLDVTSSLPIYGEGDFGRALKLECVLDEQAEVTIDIKPQSSPNCFNNNGHGVTPVAILGSETFDVTTVNIETIMLDGAAVAVKGKGKIMCHVEDVTGSFDPDTGQQTPEYPGAPDGYLDLVCQIEDIDGIYEQGEGEGVLTALLTDGETTIEASDSVCVTQ